MSVNDGQPSSPSGRWDAPEEFDEFVRTRHTALLRFAHLLSGDPHAAADLVQEALERAGLRWRSIRRKDAPEAYVRQSILNAHLNHARRRRREHLVADAPEVRSDAGPPGRDEVLWRLLATLPPQQRAVLVLRFYEDLSEADVARVLGCPIGTVKSAGFRALARLRSALPPGSAESADTTTGGEVR